MAAQPSKDLIMELFPHFHNYGAAAVFVAPSSIDIDTMRLLCNLPEAQRDKFFRAHCFYLPGPNDLSAPLVSTQGHVVHVEKGADGVETLRNGNVIVPVVKHIQAANGNHIFRVKGLLYPSATEQIVDAAFVWTPFMYILTLSECSNMIGVMWEAGLFQKYSGAPKQPFSIFLPRNDTFTEEHREWLNSKSPGERRMFAKRHIVKGFVFVDSRKYAEETPERCNPVTQVETLSTDYLALSAKHTHRRILPFIGIRDPGEIFVSAHCVEIHTLLRGMVILIDSPLYAFPADLSTRTAM